MHGLRIIATSTVAAEVIVIAMAILILILSYYFPGWAAHVGYMRSMYIFGGGGGE